MVGNLYLLVHIPDSLFYKYLSQLALLRRIEKQKSVTLKTLNSQRENFKRLIDEASDQIKKKFRKLLEEINDFVQEASPEKANSNLLVSKNIEEQLVDLIARGRVINDQERYLQFDVSQFQHCESELKRFSKFSDLWELAEKIRFVRRFSIDKLRNSSRGRTPLSCRSTCTR